MRIFRKRLERLEKANPKNEMPWSLEWRDGMWVAEDGRTFTPEDIDKRKRNGLPLAFTWSDAGDKV